SELLEQPLAVDPVDGDLIAGGVAQRAHVDMATDAPRVYLGADQQRRVPVFRVTVRHRNRVERRTLSIVAGRASKLVGRMLADDLVEVGVGAERLGGVLEALFVFRRM